MTEVLQNHVQYVESWHTHERVMALIRGVTHMNESWHSYKFIRVPWKIDLSGQRGLIWVPWLVHIWPDKHILKGLFWGDDIRLFCGDFCIFCKTWGVGTPHMCDSSYECHDLRCSILSKIAHKQTRTTLADFHNLALLPKFFYFWLNCGVIFCCQP